MDDREVFFSVVEANGFGAAARRLETTPASVSRRVKALEQRLGVRLLQRTTRKLSMTEAGERYYREGRRLLHELDYLEQAIEHGTVSSDWMRNDEDKRELAGEVLGFAHRLRQA